MKRHVRAFGLACFLLGLSTPAAAETAVLRASVGSLAEDVRAHAAVHDALVDAKLRVIDAADLRKLGKGAGLLCFELECGAQVLEAAGAEMYVAVSVSHVEGEPEVVVGLGDRLGHRVYGEETVHGGDVVRAARFALEHALLLWPAREPVVLHVRGTPAGASVYLDNQPRGVLPAELRVRPGQHTIRVESEGFGAEERLRQIPHGKPHDEVFGLGEVTPQPAPSFLRRRAAKGLIGGGAGALLLGAVYTGFALRAKLRDGDCANADAAPYPCKRNYHAGSETHTRLLLGLGLDGVGAAALATGLWLYRAEQQSVQLQVHADVAQAGVALRGDF
jgi:hypothetical protein